MASAVTASMIKGTPVVIVRLHGREFLFVNRCTHLPNCDLSKGRIDGSTLICICGWQYDLLTGRAVNHPLARIELIEK